MQMFNEEHLCLSQANKSIAISEEEVDSDELMTHNYHLDGDLLLHSEVDSNDKRKNSRTHKNPWKVFYLLIH